MNLTRRSVQRVREARDQSNEFLGRATHSVSVADRDANLRAAVSYLDQVRADTRRLMAWVDLSVEANLDGMAEVLGIASSVTGRDAERLLARVSGSYAYDLGPSGAPDPIVLDGLVVDLTWFHLRGSSETLDRYGARLVRLFPHRVIKVSVRAPGNLPITPRFEGGTNWLLDTDGPETHSRAGLGALAAEAPKEGP